jgi:hypothetical protein
MKRNIKDHCGIIARSLLKMKSLQPKKGIYMKPFTRIQMIFLILVQKMALKQTNYNLATKLPTLENPQASS